MKRLLKVNALAAALALCLLPSGLAAQERRPPVERDAGALRRALAEALGGEFEVVRDALTRRSAYHGGGAYWLAHVRPKRPGSFTLKYAYRYEDPFAEGEAREKRAEHTFHLNVGPRGCWRRQQHFMTAFYQPCLGDTVILPFALDAYRRVYTGHAFEFTVNSAGAQAAAAGPEDWEVTLTKQQDAELRRDAAFNPAAEHLKYLGSSVSVMPHRALGFTAEYHAAFEAVRPGRFNLLLGVSAHGGGAAGGVPVIVVERGTPVTWLAAQESVSEYTGRFSSHAGNSYLTSPVILQPGERLTLRYGGLTRRGRSGEAEREGVEQNHPPPVITRLPFRVNPDEGFNEWLVGHLPK